MCIFPPSCHLWPDLPPSSCPGDVMALPSLPPPPPCWSGIYRDLPASASQVLRIKVCA
ncbi:mCG147822, partial [Mus musculus]